MTVIGAADDAGLQVRDATPVDLDELAHVWHEAWHDAHAHLVPQELARSRTVDCFRARLIAGLSTVRMLGSPGAPVGFCVVDGALLDHLFVAASARGTGVADALIADAERILAERGVETAWLTCAVGNGRAARFYAKHAWRYVRTTVEHAATPLGIVPVLVWRYEKCIRHG